MLERPELTDDALLDALRSSFGLVVDELVFMPLGNDSAAWTYRARSNAGDDWFVKVRRSVRPAAVLVPSFLASRGFEEVVPVRPALTGAPWIELGPWFVLVQPYVDAPTGYRGGFNEGDWHNLGRFAARLHAQTLPSDLRSVIGREDFHPVATDLARRVDRHVLAGPPPTDAIGARVTAGWLERREVIERLVQRSEELAAGLRERLAARGERDWFVLCHADLHIANVLVRPDGRLVVIDWDETTLAPPERDLMFVRGAAIVGTVEDHEATAFETGYGSSASDPVLIAWYRIDWAIQDLADFARRVLLDPSLGPATRARAADLFDRVFKAGGEVDGAVAADASIAG